MKVTNSDFQVSLLWLKLLPSLEWLQADFNGDGWNDLCLGSKLFPMQPETGRVNGGLGMLLLGSETGLFTPEYRTESGLVIPSDTTSLSLMDINSDHRPDLVVASNNQHFPDIY